LIRSGSRPPLSRRSRSVSGTLSRFLISAEITVILRAKVLERHIVRSTTYQPLLRLLRLKVYQHTYCNNFYPEPGLNSWLRLTTASDACRLVHKVPPSPLSRRSRRAVRTLSPFHISAETIIKKTRIEPREEYCL